jgi:hypothetical protein
MANEISRSVARASTSALVGILGLSLFERLERRVLGREPLYTSTRITRRLARRLGVSLDEEQARVLGRLLRFVYGPALGLVRARLDRRPGLGRALRLGAAIWLFELLALPATGATPPLRRWPRGEKLLLAAHTTAFALAAELAS